MSCSDWLSLALPRISGNTFAQRFMCGPLSAGRSQLMHRAGVSIGPLASLEQSQHWTAILGLTVEGYVVLSNGRHACVPNSSPRANAKTAAVPSLSIRRCEIVAV